MSKQERFVFTFGNIRRCFATALACGYEVLTCADFVREKQRGLSSRKILVNRVDIDVSCKKARRLAQLFGELGIKASFFVRLHGAEYNPFSFEDYRCLRQIRDEGHEIGFHSEVVDESLIWSEDAAQCLKRDLQVLSTMLSVEIKGVSSHGGMTGYNNLDFWKDKRPQDFGLTYEAYDTEPAFDLFGTSLYVSDSSWTHWKCYENGKLREGDNRSLADHCRAGHPVIYALIHPESYFDEHFYE